jgi:hypothetical protein
MWVRWFTFGDTFHHCPADGIRAKGDKWLYALIGLIVLVVCRRTHLAVEIVKALGGH